MGLDLNLASARLKWERAREHLETLQAKVKVHTTIRINPPPYTVWQSPIDPQSGYAEYGIATRDISEPRFGVLFGDVVHNLRCALDYIVVELVRTSHTPLLKQHQFPIFLTPGAYDRSVNGRHNPLHGVLHATDLIRELQPFHRQTDQRGDPLWHLHHYSNADKHRQIAGMHFIPTPSVKHPMKFLVYGSIGALTVTAVPLSGYAPDGRYVLIRGQWAWPFPDKVYIEHQVPVTAFFRTDAWEDETAYGISPTIIGNVCDHVGMVLNLFEQL